MALFSNLSFTWLVRDRCRAGLGTYVEALVSVLTEWEGVDSEAVSFKPDDPLGIWCPPTGGADPNDSDRLVTCRVHTGSSKIRTWHLTLHATGVTCIVGSVFPEDDEEDLDWRGFGDHLIRSSVADTSSNVDDWGYVRGYASSIYLTAKLDALRKHVSQSAMSGTTPVGPMSRALTDVFRSGSFGDGIIAVEQKRRVRKKFLARCDAELMERWGTENFARALEPLEISLQRWRRAF